MNSPRKPISPNSRVLRFGRGFAVGTASLVFSLMLYSQYQVYTMRHTPLGEHEVDRVASSNEARRRAAIGAINDVQRARIAAAHAQHRRSDGGDVGGGT